MNSRFDVVVVGGGLAGLAGAAYLGRSGLRVAIAERAAHLGGRAATQVHEGFSLNLGPHALYRGGPAHAVLTELGVPFTGAMPRTGGLAVRHGELHALPASPRGLVSTTLFGVAGKLELAKLFGRILSRRFDTRALDGSTLGEWIQSHVRDAAVREWIEALARLSTYGNAPERLSAGAAFDQLRLAGKQGVLYLDGGWQTLVDGLAKAATAAGVTLRTGARVDAVESRDPSGRLTVRLEGGEPLMAQAVLVAGSPATAQRLVGRGRSPLLDACVAAAEPVHAACLDVALSALTAPRRSFALGVDRPLYLSVHTSVAKLAPAGGSVVHVAKYLPVGVETRAEDDRAELVGLLDLVQPGWRAHLVHERFLPDITVQSDVVSAARGGLPGRALPEVADVPGLFVAGDWVGPVGLLADGALASARSAGAAITARLGQRVVRAA